MKDTLILYANKTDFDIFYLKNMCTETVDAYPIYEYKNRWVNYAMEAHMLSGLPGISLWFESWKNEVEKYSTIIIFEALPTEYIIEYIRQKNPNCRIIYWYWNTVKRAPKHRETAEYWSFDCGDCEKYNLSFNNQFGFIIGERNNKANTNSDVFFVGQDKNRFELIKNIEKKLRSFNLNTDFYIVRDKTSKKDENAGIIESMLPYREVVDKLKSSRCLLELVKNGQTGVTLRFIEAAFYGKKVITNNKSVIGHPLYDKSRVFILDQDNWDDLPKFFSRETEFLSEDLIRPYTYEGWLQKFFDERTQKGS